MNLAQDQPVRPFEPTEDLSPAAIETFLAISGWSQVDRREGICAIWESRDEGASIFLPYDATYRDYRARLVDALRTIADVYQLTSQEALALKIAGARSDILLVRAEQEILDGSIPLIEAQNLLEGVRGMLTAAACSAIRPRASNQGRRPDAAAGFVAQEVRMGHTLRGSFVITILARHDEELVEELPAPERTEELPSTATPAVRSFQPVLGSYTRRVMTTLATGLSATHDLLRDTPGISLDDAVLNGASTELIDAIAKMSSNESLNALDLSFRWSPAQPTPPEHVANRITLRRPQPDRLIELRDSLRKRPVVEQDDLVGQVVRLERAEGQDEGIVVVDGYLGRNRRRVKIRLSGEDYRRAIRAHEDRVAIITSGEVVLEKRSWWLKNVVNFDVRTW
ncbi:hypothetical protein [Nonomuraea dietziae]|uniref:hypothetical protein n=1 Tax=Nonomuraea dietziae TaxID=65515 RepID=UPI003413FE93